MLHPICSKTTLRDNTPLFAVGKEGRGEDNRANQTVALLVQECKLSKANLGVELRLRCKNFIVISTPQSASVSARSRG
jgi:hypothetical protein